VDTAGVSPIPTNTQGAFVRNVMKVFAAAYQRNLQTDSNGGISLDGLGCSDDELLACDSTLMANIEIYTESPDAEVKERTFSSLQLLLKVLSRVLRPSH
jgi:hypothetical protein